MEKEYAAMMYCFRFIVLFLMVCFMCGIPSMTCFLNTKVSQQISDNMASSLTRRYILTWWSLSAGVLTSAMEANWWKSIQLPHFGHNNAISSFIIFDDAADYVITLILNFVSTVDL